MQVLCENTEGKQCTPECDQPTTLELFILSNLNVTLPTFIDRICK